MPPFDSPNKFSVPFKKRFITLSSSLLMDLLIKVTGYNSKFFFLLKTGLEVQTNAYSQSAKRVIRKIRCNFNLTIAPPSVFSFDIFEIKLPNE